MENKVNAGPKIIQFPHAAKIWGTDKNIIAEVITIRPQDATAWLKCNRLNRPVRRSHVAFLAQEITNEHWQVNGQAIVIADDEAVLDGQHRLLAIIEAGMPIQSLVVYGISPEAFRTIDTGAVRTSADALALHYHDEAQSHVTAVATAAQWCVRMERGFTRSRLRLSNTDVIEYVKEHPSMFSCVETLIGYPREARPMSLGCGTALYEMFQRKHSEQADAFMRNLFTGENLARTDPEYLLRHIFIRDAEQRVAKLPIAVRMRMVIKGWNWRRRGKDEAKRENVMIRPDEDPKVRIF
jgi:hypothetical protein